jgi:hypothetical protein
MRLVVARRCRHRCTKREKNKNAMLGFSAAAAAMLVGSAPECTADGQLARVRSSPARRLTHNANAYMYS